MAAWRSIRFRLSVQYSAVVFGLGGALLGLVYLAIRQWLRGQTMTRYVISGQMRDIDGVEVVVPQMEEQQMRAIESIYNEIVLNEVARFTLFALVALFMLSLIVGWVMSGRVLKPVEEITKVARDIQASDLSRRIGLEGPDDEMTRLASTFDGMLERLDTAFTSQRQFLADTSHDLRTPLAVIQSNVEVVASDENASAEEWREVGQIVRRNVEKMSEMIDDLLAAARLQTGRAQAVMIDLAEIVSAKQEEYASIAEDKGVTIATQVGPVVIEGVEVALDRAISNLLDNSVGVSTSGSTITIGSGLVDDWAWVGVQDEGPGLPDEPDGGRIGLGLSIVSQVADAHGGVLAPIEHTGRKGTTMVIWLPTSDAPGSHPDISPFTGS